MRASLPAIVFLSAAFHLVLMAGIGFSFFSWKKEAVAPAHSPPSALILMTAPSLGPQSLRAPELPAPIKPEKIVKALPPTQPQARLIAEATFPGTPPAPPLPSLPEINPNLNAPAPAAETLLSPIPPPRLNSRAGTVFLLDVSGSMYEPYAGTTRLVFARQNLARRIRALPDGTPFAIVLYAQTMLPSGPLVTADNATREAAVRFIMRDYDCGGGTNLSAGLEAAQKLQAGNLVLISDGDLNTSQINLCADVRHLLGRVGQGPFLTLVGICPRPNTTAVALLQGLADQQAGTYSSEQVEEATALLTSERNTEVH